MLQSLPRESVCFRNIGRRRSLADHQPRVPRCNAGIYLPVHILLYTLPGIPSVYYGSEFGIEGHKERFSDDSLRPAIDLAEHADNYETNLCTQLIAALGAVHARYADDLAWGPYRELALTTEQYAFSRRRLIVVVNNADKDTEIDVPAEESCYVGLLGGEQLATKDGKLHVSLPACGGEIFAPEGEGSDVGVHLSFAEQFAPKGAPTLKGLVEETDGDAAADGPAVKLEDIPDVPYDQMTVEQLQAVILAKMAKNGPVNDQMRRDVMANVWRDSLVNWAKSFR